MTAARSPESCARVVARLDRWVDGALDATEAALDRGHMEACAACDGARERRLQMLEHLRRAASVPASAVDALWKGVAARLGNARPARARPRILRVHALVGAAAAILVLVLLQAATGASSPTLHPDDLVSVEHVLEVLPGWSDVVRGVGSLSRGFS